MTQETLLQEKLDHYWSEICNLQVDCTLKKPITNVLLTGATGYLGCNLLHQLLTLTPYKVYLPVRALSQEEAEARIQRKFQFYFDRPLEQEAANQRVVVIPADIEKDNLGLSPEAYQDLSEQIDSVIHAAALVKHYGDKAQFHSANIQATLNLLDFSKLTKAKDFHHISTYSVLTGGFVPDCLEYAYTEEDTPDNLTHWDNLYVQTKHQAEQQVFQYREQGVNGSIYRIGNLAFMAENARIQENAQDNAFLHRLQCLIKLECIAENFDEVEISPVDLTAQAIVLLFDKKALDNRTHHVFNPHLFRLSEGFSQAGQPITVLKMEAFIDTLIEYLDKPNYHDLVSRFLLHQGWLEGYNVDHMTLIHVLGDKTRYALKQLGFEWPQVTSELFSQYLDKGLPQLTT